MSAQTLQTVILFGCMNATVVPTVVSCVMARGGSGHFDAIFQMGRMHFQGDGMPRSCQNALAFLSPAARSGGWGSAVRGSGLHACNVV